MAELQVLQVSVIYVETNIELLTGDLKNPPFAFLANRFDFAKKFDETAADRSGDLQPPWPDKVGKSFWRYYFEDQKKLEDITGKEAWHGVAPLRHRFPLEVSASPADIRVAPEAFIYPHGVAVVINVIIHGAFTPLEAAEMAVKMRRGKEYLVEGEAEPVVLDEVASRARSALRRLAFGNDASAGRQPPTPFSVTSVVVGKDVDPTKPPPQDSDEQRFLDAVSTWAPTWKNAALPKIAEHSLGMTKEGPPAGHVLYARDRARAVWFPESFGEQAGYIHTLTCFHRNLVLASLQVESLAGLAGATAKRLADGDGLTQPLRNAASLASGILGRLYGARSTYKSRSPRAQLEDGDLVADVDAMRAAVQQPPLFVPPPAI